MMFVETTTRALLQAQATPVVQRPDLAGILITTVIFTVFGLLVFGIAYFIIVKASPFSIRKEIEDDQNIALAIIIGSVIIGVSLIIAAAVHG
jgi:putative membrane protein